MIFPKHLYKQNYSTFQENKKLTLASSVLTYLGYILFLRCMQIGWDNGRIFRRPETIYGLFYSNGVEVA